MMEAAHCVPTEVDQPGTSTSTSTSSPPPPHKNLFLTQLLPLSLIYIGTTQLTGTIICEASKHQLLLYLIQSIVPVVSSIIIRMDRIINGACIILTILLGFLLWQPLPSGTPPGVFTPLYCKSTPL